jgi:hypothetical protein
MKIEAVKCERCGRLHDAKLDTFITIYGNVCRGLNKGIIGNNLDENQKVVGEAIFCYPDCIAKILEIETKYDRQFT